LAGTNYLGVSGTNAETRDGLFTANERVRLTDILDGTSQTLLVGERILSGTDKQVAGVGSSKKKEIDDEDSDRCSDAAGGGLGLPKALRR
jgi:hypothetical protein